MDGTEAQGSATVVEEVEPKAPAAKQPADPKAQKQGSSQPADKGKAKESGPPPWAKDLEERGLNEPAFDEYLREVWQPRMTQHEQSLAEWEGLFGDGGMEAAKIGAGLLEALETDPEGTYRQIGELLGLTEEQVEEMVEEEGGYEGEVEETEAADPRQEYIDRLMQQEREAQEDAQYNALLEAMGQQFPGFDEELFNMCMIVAEGDLQAAMQTYSARHKDPEPQDTAPPTLGDAAGSTPREAPTYSSIGDSIDAFLSEEKARRG